MKYYQNILKLIGNTPLVKINKINPNPDVLILAKCEKFNPAEDYVNDVVKKQPDKYFYLNQYANKNNPAAHYRYTAEEILSDCDGELDVFIAGLGTSGTLMGVSSRLKEYNPSIKIIGVEPLKGHGVQGLKNLEVSYVPPVFDESKN